MMSIYIPDDATQEELIRLSKTNPAEVAQHPNISPELFKELINDWPLEASLNIAVPLWELEDPTFMDKLSRENVVGWIRKLLTRVSQHEATRFALACTLRVATLCQKSEVPIEMALRWLNGVKYSDSDIHEMSDSYYKLSMNCNSRIEACALKCLARTLRTMWREYNPAVPVSVAKEASLAKGYLIAHHAERIHKTRLKENAAEVRDEIFRENMWQWEALRKIAIYKDEP